MSFQVGANDANLLTEELGGGLLPQDLMQLPKYTAYVRLLLDGMPSRPFSIETLAPDERDRPHRLPVVRSVTRHRYAMPAAKVEEEIEQAFVAA